MLGTLLNKKHLPYFHDLKRPPLPHTRHSRSGNDSTCFFIWFDNLRNTSTMEKEEGVFYPEDTGCCEKCIDVHFEHTYPAHTAYYACINLKCECHKEVK